MGSNNKSIYNVDIVFCIDCTESMDNILNIVKQRALGFYDDIQKMMKSKDKEIDQLRVKIVAFRDYLAYDEELRKGAHCNEPMLMSDFFVLPADAHKFQVSVKSLQPVGGGDEQEDGLEALAYAIKSKWVLKGTKERHVIVLWTDQAPHYIGYGNKSKKYPRGMARNMDELTAWWGDKKAPGYMPDQSAKRLVMFAPNEGAWKTISESWNLIAHYPSKAGDHLKDVDYQTILNMIGQTL